MKTALFLCILIGAVLVLGGCAEQTTTSRTTGSLEHGVYEPTLTGGTGGGGGSHGPIPVSKQP